SGACGVYCTEILLNEKLTRSNSAGLLLASPASVSMGITRPFSILVDRDSSGVLPILRRVSVASLIISLVRRADIRAVDDLSTRLVIRSSRMVALPRAPPPHRGGC